MRGDNTDVCCDAPEEQPGLANVGFYVLSFFLGLKTVKGSPYSITERRVPELLPVLGSQPASDVSHEPGGRLPLLFASL